MAAAASGRFGAGSFEGPKLKGTVLPGGACSMLMRRDDVLEIEARITLETDDKQQIYIELERLPPRPEGGHRSP